MCVGADVDFSCAVVDVTPEGTEPPYEVAHPCTLKGMKWAACWADEIRSELPPLERNRVIVNSVDILLVGPKGPEELRSDTWSCVRYGRQQKRNIVFFWPDGSVTEENGNG